MSIQISIIADRAKLTAALSLGGECTSWDCCWGPPSGPECSHPSVQLSRPGLQSKSAGRRRPRPPLLRSGLRCLGPTVAGAIIISPKISIHQAFHCQAPAKKEGLCKSCDNVDSKDFWLTTKIFGCEKAPSTLWQLTSRSLFAFSCLLISVTLHLDCVITSVKSQPWSHIPHNKS